MKLGQATIVALLGGSLIFGSSPLDAGSQFGDAELLVPSSRTSVRYGFPIEGRLVVGAGGCVALRDAKGVESTVVFPAGTVPLPSAGSIGMPGEEPLALGDAVITTGALVTANRAPVFVPYPCRTTRVAVLDG